MLPEIRIIRYNNARFEEGCIYPFSILKRIDVSENEAYYVLLDPKGYKILLPAEVYAHYGFEAGAEILCRIDKINCSGQVFLEPLHPVYTENETYAFEINRRWIEEVEGNEKQYFIELTDVNKMPYSLKVSEGDYEAYSSASLINCRIERIKKAKLHLQAVHKTESDLIFIPGHYYTLKVKNLAGEFYNLTDTNGNTHQLESKWYDHYNIKEGDEIRCKFLYYSENGSLVLEPENPFYREGELYEFPIRYIQKMEYADGSSDATAIADDVFGEEAHLKLPSGWVDQIAGKTMLSARVDRLRKSRVHGTVIF